MGDILGTSLINPAAASAFMLFIGFELLCPRGEKLPSISPALDSDGFFVLVRPYILGS